MFKAGVKTVLIATLFLVGCEPPASQDPVPHAIAGGGGAEDAAKKKADLGSSSTSDGGITPACVLPIDYHGGPVIHGTFNVYYIWYGNWSSNTAGSILTELASNIGGSPYYNINTTYYDTTGTHVANKVAYAGSTNDDYSRGQSINDNDVKNIVSDAIAGARLPKDSNGLYFVLATSDVAETSGFCTNYCGWHNHGSIQSADIKYSFVGNPDRCPNTCLSLNRAASPNDNPGADGMASVIAHELDGAATNPDQNAWYFDASRFDNADQCAWTYGPTMTLPNGSEANLTLGTRNYLLQENWVNDSCGRCALSYP